MLVVPFAERTLDHALEMGRRLMGATREESAACFAASLVEGPAVLLGSHQRAARVLDVGRCRAAKVPVLRRATAGTAAFVGQRALVLSLALPHVAALFPDATPRTLLNRNVRPFLRGLTAAGALAHYFGREWVSVRKRPAMVLGFDAAEDGALLIEAIAGLEEPFALPDDLASDDERAAERFAGHAPGGLAEVLPAGRTAEEVARCVADAIAARASTAVTVRADSAVAVGTGVVAPSSVDLDSEDPVPPGATLIAPARIPIGWLERAIVHEAGSAPRTPWLGGDVLAPRFVLDRAAAVASGQTGSLGAGPLEGVSEEELLEKARGAR